MYGKKKCKIEDLSCYVFTVLHGLREDKVKIIGQVILYSQLHHI